MIGCPRFMQIVGFSEGKGDLRIEAVACQLIASSRIDSGMHCQSSDNASLLSKRRHSFLFYPLEKRANEDGYRPALGARQGFREKPIDVNVNSRNL